MSKLAKALSGAAGSAGGDPLYVEDVFSTFLYNGTGSSNAIDNGIDLSGEGGLVWGKRRNLGNSHWLINTVNGIASRLESDGTGAATDKSTSFTSFNSNGFTVATGDNEFNNANGTYASWTFRKAEKFFDIQEWSGNDVQGREISHALGSTPACIICKDLDTSTNWIVYHSGTGATKATYLNTTDAATTASLFWDDTAPTDSVFTIGDFSSINASGRNYVAYLFASDAGGYGDDGTENIIKCGTFTTNSASTPADIDLGFEPQFFMYKPSNIAGNWFMADTMRGWTAQNTSGESAETYLYANLTAAESSPNTWGSSPNATGINWRAEGLTANDTYIYMAIRRPMKTPEAGTEVYTTIARAGNNVTTQIPTGFTTDMFLSTTRNQTWYHAAVWDRLRGTSKFVLTSTTGAEQGNTAQFTSFDQDGITVGPDSSGWINNAGATYVYNLFKRATGFMDVVAYTGNATIRTIAHNLGVVPELMLFKNRSTSNIYWIVYNSTDGAEKYLILNEDNSVADSIDHFNDTEPTSSVFTVGDAAYTNRNTDGMVAYLFATLAGVSKVGNYTGTGADLNVDCGFTAGARFILIKRTDSAGDWYTWDSVRGISAGNDPYLLLNDEAVEVTGTDYVDPLNAGFTVTSNASSTVNVNGGTYIFLAIA